MVLLCSMNEEMFLFYCTHVYVQITKAKNMLAHLVSRVEPDLK